MSLVGIDDMHKLGANRAAVGRLKTIYYFFESRTVSADVQATCLESGHKKNRCKSLPDPRTFRSERRVLDVLLKERQQ